MHWLLSSVASHLSLIGYGQKFSWTLAHVAVLSKLNHLEGDNCVLAHEVDHVLLNYVPVQPSLSPHQVIHIKASFQLTSLYDHYEIKRCGLGLMYVNEEVNCNNVPIIQFNSLFSTPPPNESTLVLKEISAGEPIECEDMTRGDQRK